MNKAADVAAKLARDSETFVKTPLLHADKFSLYTDTGISTTHVTKWLEEVWKSTQPAILRRSGNVYKYQHEYLFTKAKNAFSVKTMYLIRSHQLPTQARSMERSGAVITQTCALCEEAATMTNERHIFVECPAIQQVLVQGSVEATRKTETFFDKRASEDQTANADLEKHLWLAQSLFIDHALWDARTASVLRIQR
ncbi:hypothetical protein BCR39DRAFT_601435 [Naematelia encephala]|uniref:Uncharacterized protein n=1 Tax=Naematelia encephala TaxID=71784 RepID=A0A1Y2AEX5_9TREE|nr:hypothetical protein BCR39DRAFT_601435 [Naematelia encephala]